MNKYCVNNSTNYNDLDMVLSMFSGGTIFDSIILIKNKKK